MTRMQYTTKISLAQNMDSIKEKNVKYQQQWLLIFHNMMGHLSGEGGVHLEQCFLSTPCIKYKHKSVIQWIADVV